MTDRSQFIGRLAGITQIVFAALIGVVASFAAEPGFIPRGAVLFMLFGLPGVIGLIGTAARRPALLVAAGLTSAIGSLIAFSGVTLIFLVPSLMFFLGAARVASVTSDSPWGGWLHGIVQLGVGVAIVVLLVGAGASALLVTDSGCWTKFETPTGGRVETAPYSTGEIEVSSGASEAGCSTGLISLRGLGLGALLGSAAVALTVLAARRRQPVADGPSARAADD
jgi:hypothetical protein